MANIIKNRKMKLSVTAKHPYFISTSNGKQTNKDEWTDGRTDHRAQPCIALMSSRTRVNVKYFIYVHADSDV